MNFTQNIKIQITGGIGQFVSVIPIEIKYGCQSFPKIFFIVEQAFGSLNICEFSFQPPIESLTAKLECI